MTKNYQVLLVVTDLNLDEKGLTIPSNSFEPSFPIVSLRDLGLFLKGTSKE